MWEFHGLYSDHIHSLPPSPPRLTPPPHPPNFIFFSVYTHKIQIYYWIWNLPGSMVDPTGGHIINKIWLIFSQQLSNVNCSSWPPPLLPHWNSHCSGLVHVVIICQVTFNPCLMRNPCHCPYFKGNHNCGADVAYNSGIHEDISTGC